MKKYIYAMSVNQQALSYQLFSASLPLTEHLAKLYIFPSLDYRDHWKKEIWNFIHRVPKLKNNNRWPSAEFIFEHISGYADDSYTTITSVINEYSKHIPERVDGAEFEDMLVAYFTWLSETLSAKGEVASSEVYAKLDDIGFLRNSKLWGVNTSV